MIKGQNGPAFGSISDSDLVSKICTAVLTACVVVSSDPRGVPVNLLNDGTVLLEVDQYLPCPNPQDYQQPPGTHGAPPPACIPPIVSSKLVVANINTSTGVPGIPLAYEFSGKNYRSNNLGQVVAWPQSHPLPKDFVMMSSQSAAAQAFAGSAFQDPSPAGCGISDGVYQWLALSNGGQLLAQVSNAACPGPFALWYGVQLKTTGALPAGYSSPSFSGINAKNQLAITAQRSVTATSTSTRALLWNGTNYSALPLPFWGLLAGYNASEAKGSMTKVMSLATSSRATAPVMQSHGKRARPQT